MPRLSDHQWEIETRKLQRRVDDLRFQLRVQWFGLGAIALCVLWSLVVNGIMRQ